MCKITDNIWFNFHELFIQNQNVNEEKQHFKVYVMYVSKIKWIVM